MMTMYRWFQKPALQTKVDIVHEDVWSYHVKERMDLFDKWILIDKTDSKEEAKQLALNRAQNVNFLGFYNNGVSCAVETHAYTNNETNQPR